MRRRMMLFGLRQCPAILGPGVLGPGVLGPGVLGPAVLGCLLLATSASAYVTLDGDRSAWSNSPTYRIINRSPDVAAAASDQAVRASFTVWNDVPRGNLNMREVNGGGDITVEFISQGWPPEVGPGAAGVTYTERARGEIFRATILINNVNFDWATDGNATDADIQGVTTHEVGHAIGLGHSRTREATMYWSGGDVQLRDLHPDDERGIRFLYGASGEGLVCDTCLGPDDCAAGGICIQLEDRRAFCGQACGANNSCPEGSSCRGLQGGGEQCVPDELFCSDDAGTGTLGQGDYCWGAAQCAAGLDCLPFPDGPTICTRQCRSDRDCDDGLTCLNGAPGSQGFCIPSGEGTIGDPCGGGTDCASLLCVPVSEEESICSDDCNPNADNCPNGSFCVEVDGVEGIDGLCIPSGSVPEGGNCAEERCAQGLQCFNLGDDLFRCLRTCDDRDPDSCGPGLSCLDADGNQGNLGICPPGDARFGEACESGLDCGSFICIGDGNGGGVCSQDCSAVNPCPDNWRCQNTINGGATCFPPNEPVGGAGGGGGTGGGAGGAGGNAGAGGGNAGAGGAGGGNAGAGGAGGGAGGAGGGNAGAGGGNAGAGGGAGGAPVGGGVGGGAGDPGSFDGGVEGGVVRRNEGGGGGGCMAMPARANPWSLALLLVSLGAVLRRRR
ncbi:MAG: matrixin family metalloprotease [Bradymonadia bacterium]